MNLSITQARALSLHSQGLAGSGTFGKNKAATLAAIEHIGYVQIDTISVVERAHHHVLWSRVPSYQPKYLDELTEEKKVFEYWSHAAAFLPMRDYRYTLVRKEHFAGGSTDWFGSEPKMKQYVLDRIRAEGALKSSDFEHSKKSNGWWSWKPAKRSLEHLFMEGSLMVARREGFQKVYDVPERVLPADVDSTKPTHEEFARHLIESSIRAHGFASVDEIAYLRNRIKPTVRKVVQQMQEEGSLVALKIEDDPQRYYSMPQLLEEKRKKPSQRIKILSPFDNAVIQRKRLRSLFGYDYQIECYVPAPKRSFGYFCLPLLLGDSFIGRIDAKAERSSGILHIYSFYIEHPPLQEYLPQLAQELWAFAAFNGCTEIRVHRTQPVKLKKELQNLIAKT